MSEGLIYQLKPGKTDVGRLDSDKPAAIRLSGESIAEEHCYFENNDGKVTLHALPNAVTVRAPTFARCFQEISQVVAVLERTSNHSWSSSYSPSTSSTQL